MTKDIIGETISSIISDHTGRRVEISKFSPVGGGCINRAQYVDTNAGRFFVKQNSADRYPGMFEAEASGLELLSGAGSIRVPGVIGYADAGSESILVLEYIEEGRKGKDFWYDFGRGLAGMHKENRGQGGFGLGHNNYIGSLPQENGRYDSWTDFFINRRLEVQLKIARDSHRAGKELSVQFSSLYRRIPELFPEEPPALLHGDLWGGNYMTDRGGRAVIIDPAVYYGHRYMDLGMSRLFGGFDTSFYNAYNEEYPLEASWQEGIEAANLYPLMVHVNLFGGSYLGSVKSVLKRFA